MTVSSKEAIKKLKSEIKVLAEKEQALAVELKKDADKVEKKLSTLKEKLEKEIKEYHDAQFQLISEIYKFAPNTVKHAQHIHDHIIQLCKEYPLFYAQLAEDGIIEPVKPKSVEKEKKVVVPRNEDPIKDQVSQASDKSAEAVVVEGEVKQEAPKVEPEVSKPEKVESLEKVDVQGLKQAVLEKDMPDVAPENMSQNETDSSPDQSIEKTPRQEQFKNNEQETDQESEEEIEEGVEEADAEDDLPELDVDDSNAEAEYNDVEEQDDSSKQVTASNINGQSVKEDVKNAVSSEIDNMKKAMKVPVTDSQAGVASPQQKFISENEENDLLDKVYDETQKMIVNREAVHSIESALQSITPEKFQYASKLERAKIQAEINYAADDLKTEAKSVDEEYQDVVDNVMDNFEEILLNNAHTPEKLTGPSNDDFETAIKEALVEIDEEVDELTMDLLISACKTEFRVQAEIIQAIVPSLQSGHAANDITDKLSQATPERKEQIEYLVEEVAKIITKQNQ